MHAFNYTLINFDSYVGYGQNYYLYKSLSNQFQPILWDLNMSFGSFRLTDDNPDGDKTWVINSSYGYNSSSSIFIENSIYSANGQYDDLNSPKPKYLNNHPEAMD